MKNSYVQILAGPTPGRPVSSPPAAPGYVHVRVAFRKN